MRFLSDINDNRTNGRKLSNWIFHEGMTMKKLPLLVIASLSLILSACSSISEQQPVDALTGKPDNLKPYPIPHCPAPKKKNPINVSIYTKEIHLTHPYKVIGLETVSKYNVVGIKRQEGNIKDTMRTIAAAMGGDAIINLKYEKHVVRGTVITYKDKTDQEMA